MVQVIGVGEEGTQNRLTVAPGTVQDAVGDGVGPGLLLWIGALVTGKFVYWATFYFHVWGSIIISVLVVCAHIPLALLSLEHFKGIWRLGPGTISVEAAEHHAPIWFERDVVRTDIEK